MGRGLRDGAEKAVALARFVQALIQRQDLIRKRSEILANLVPHAAENGNSLVFGTMHGGGVFKVVMDGDGLPGKDGAGLFGVVANGQNVIEMLPAELLDGLGMLAGNVNAQLAHDCDRLGADVAGPGTGALHFETITCVVTQ